MLLVMWLVFQGKVKETSQHLALVVASGVALFLFATSLHRELKERDLLYILPALAMASLIWTVLTWTVYKSS